MILKDADSIIDTLQYLIDEAGWGDECNLAFETAIEVVENSRPFEVIQVEQVARMISEVALNGIGRPCDLNECDLISKRDEFCKFGKCNGRDTYDCWLHALKEGWLDV